jgi:DNA-directed RNA polymerase subunit beta
LLFIDGASSSDSIRKTLLLDKVATKEEALIEIYRLLRPGNPATPEVAQDFLDHLFFKSSYYDLSGVGGSRSTCAWGSIRRSTSEPCVKRTSC